MYYGCNQFLMCFTWLLWLQLVAQMLLGLLWLTHPMSVGELLRLWMRALALKCTKWEHPTANVSFGTMTSMALKGEEPEKWQISLHHRVILQIVFYPKTGLDLDFSYWSISASVLRLHGLDTGSLSRWILQRFALVDMVWEVILQKSHGLVKNKQGLWRFHFAIRQE